MSWFSNMHENNIYILHSSYKNIATVIIVLETKQVVWFRNMTHNYRFPMKIFTSKLGMRILAIDPHGAQRDVSV